MFDQWTLSNGLRVVGEYLPHVRSASIGVWIKVGSMMETPQENGLSHFIEHMVFKGTGKRSARDIAEEMDAVGGQLNAFTSKECTCFYAKVIDEDLPLAVDILSDLTLNATLDERELNKERGVILEEISMVEDTPEDLVHELLSEAQFQGQALGMPILGPAERIRGYSRNDLAAFKSTHYRPENVVVAIAGNYDRAALEKLLSAAFGSWMSAGATDMPGQMNPQSQRVLFRDKDTEQVHICLGYPGKPMGHNDIYPMAVFNNILGGGMSSRLFQRVREELGMAYTIYSYPATYPNCGVLNLYAGSSPENAGTVLEQMNIEAKKLLKDGVTDKEFNQAKAQLKGSNILGLESASGRMQAIGRGELLLRHPPTPEETIDKIQKVTKEDVLRVAEETLSIAPSVAVVGRHAEKYLQFIQK
jgi:predicted Zn-dependent peptidase